MTLIIKEKSRTVSEKTETEVRTALQAIAKINSLGTWADSRGFVYKVMYDKTGLTAGEISQIDTYLASLGIT